MIGGAKRGNGLCGGKMLSGLHDYTEETSGIVCEFLIHGPKEDVLDLVSLLRKTEGVGEVALRSDSADPYPYAGSLKALRVEATGGGRLLVERAGTTLKIKGARESMEALAEEIYQAARLVGGRVNERLVDDVIVETIDEPYMDASSKSLSIEIYQPG